MIYSAWSADGESLKLQWEEAKLIGGINKVRRISILPHQAVIVEYLLLTAKVRLYSTE